MINIEDFDPNSLKIDEKLYKNINVYYIGYITMKNLLKFVKIKRVIPFYLIITEVDKHIKEKNGNKYLILDSAEMRSTNKNKNVLRKYTELWNGTMNEIETINGSK